MIEPNRLSVPGEAAARGRVEALFQAIDRLNGADLAGVVVSARDGEPRTSLLAELEARAAERGRTRLLDEARGAVRDTVLTRISSEWPAGTYTARPRATARAEDQVALVAALEDAAAVAVMEDALDPGTAAWLGEPGWTVLGLESPLGAASARTDEIDPSRPGTTGRHLAWEPSPDDWQEAAIGETAVDRHVSPAGTRGLRVAFFGLAGVGGVLGAITWGVATDQLPLAALIAAAVAAVCWTMATYRAA